MKIKSAMATLLVRGGLLTEGYFGGIPLGRSTHTGTQTSSEGEFSSSLAAPLGFLLSLHHSVRSHQHIRRDRQTNLLSGFQIDDELEFRRLLDREVRRLCTFENLVHVRGGTAIHIGKAHSVAHKPPGFDKS